MRNRARGREGDGGKEYETEGGEIGRGVENERRVPPV